MGQMLIGAHLLVDIQIDCAMLNMIVKLFRLTYLAKVGWLPPPPPSFNLNYCLSDLLLIVNLYTYPSSTRIQTNNCQYLSNARDRGS